MISCLITSSNFLNNRGAGGGGDLLVRKHSLLNVQRCELQGGVDAFGGSISLFDNSQAIVESTRFGGSGSHQGGTIYIRKTSSLVIRDSSLTLGSATEGGCIFMLETSTANITNTTFDQCSASVDGGGIYLLSSSVATLTTVEMTNCEAASRGGALFLDEVSKISSKNTMILQSTAIKGAGIFLGRGSFASLRSTDITEGNKLISTRSTTHVHASGLFCETSFIHMHDTNVNVHGNFPYNIACDGCTMTGGTVNNLCTGVIPLIQPQEIVSNNSTHPTRGGSQTIIKGLHLLEPNAEFTQIVKALVDGRLAGSANILSPEELEIVVPAGLGQGLVKLFIEGRVSPSQPSTIFKYDNPLILSVAPCVIDGTDIRDDMETLGCNNVASLPSRFAIDYNRGDTILIGRNFGLVSETYLPDIRFTEKSIEYSCANALRLTECAIQCTLKDSFHSSVNVSLKLQSVDKEIINIPSVEAHIISESPREISASMQALTQCTAELRVQVNWSPPEIDNILSYIIYWSAEPVTNPERAWKQHSSIPSNNRSIILFESELEVGAPLFVMMAAVSLAGEGKKSLEIPLMHGDVASVVAAFPCQINNTDAKALTLSEVQIRWNPILQNSRGTGGSAILQYIIRYSKDQRAVDTAAATIVNVLGADASTYTLTNLETGNVLFDFF